MRKFGIVALCVALGACAASREEVVARLGSQYVGQNVDALVVKFGPPANTFKMNSGLARIVAPQAARRQVGEWLIADCRFLRSGSEGQPWDRSGCGGGTRAPSRH